MNREMALEILHERYEDALQALYETGQRFKHVRSSDPEYNLAWQAALDRCKNAKEHIIEFEDAINIRPRQF